jgi:HSP20 family molecular chaperone IbpA
MFGLLKPSTQTPATATPSSPAATVATSQRPTAVPRVDIRETDAAVILTADMPGVPANGVEVQVHGDVLTLRGTSAIAEPERLTALWREYAARDYERSFRLGQAIDSERVGATVKDGVVRVTLPKRVAAQARRIPVTAG